MPSLPLLLDQTIGGAISTGSHGSGMFGTISDQIVAMVVVLRNGKIKRLEEGKDDELLKVFRCGLGLVGVICEVSLNVSLRKYVRRSEIEVPTKIEFKLDEMKILEIVDQYEHVWIQWKLGAKAIALVLKECDNDSGEVYNGRNFYPFSTELEEMVADRDKIDNLALIADVKKKKFYTMQYSFPLSKLGRLLETIGKLVVYTGRMFELKFLRVSGRTIYAPNSFDAVEDERVVCLNVWWSCFDVNELDDLEEKMKELLGRVHFGKWFNQKDQLYQDVTKQIDELLGFHCKEE